MIIRVCCLSIDAAVPLISIWATPADHAHAANRRPAAARNTLAARAVLRALLARETGRATWSLRTDGSGKPFAWTPEEKPGPAVTLSHSAAMVAVAIGAPGTALGIDIEAHKPRAYDDIAALAFGPAECAAVKTCGAEAFYRIWTAREALVKARGGGFAEVLHRHDQVGAGCHLGCWERDGFFFQHQRPIDLYSLTVAADVRLPLTADVALM